MTPTIVEYEIFYNNFENGLSFDKITIENIKKYGLFKHEKIYDGILFSIKDDMELLEFLFALTSNIYEEEDEIIEYNPLCMEDVQETIRRSNAHHTSMSVGDVVSLKRPEHEKQYYICASFGFKDITEHVSLLPDNTLTQA